MAGVVFMGTPEFGVPVLEALVKHHDVVMVVTQPDRRSGRGRKTLQASPVKDAATALSLQVMQPASLRREPEAVRQLAELKADLFVIAAFGQILRSDVLAIPPHGCIGVHASLLPRWRGAAPIAAAIRHGDAETGITLMLTDKGMDTGAIIRQRSLNITDTDTTETLSGRLAHLGAELLIETLPAWLAGEITPLPQDDALATNAPPIDKSEGAIDWSRTAVEIERQIRALTPWPGAYCQCGAQPFKILAAHLTPQSASASPGTVLDLDGQVAVATGDGLLILETVQLAGKRAMDAGQFARGRQDLDTLVLD